MTLIIRHVVIYLCPYTEIRSLIDIKNFDIDTTKGIKGRRAKLPWAFTESGIYMLMTVLKDDLAVQQSRALIRTFRAMKDYIIENQDLVGRHEFTQLQLVVSKNSILTQIDNCFIHLYVLI